MSARSMNRAVGKCALSLSGSLEYTRWFELGLGRRGARLTEVACFQFSFLAENLPAPRASWQSLRYCSGSSVLPRFRQ